VDNWKKDKKNKNNTFRTDLIKVTFSKLEITRGIIVLHLTFHAFSIFSQLKNLDKYKEYSSSLINLENQIIIM